MPVIDGPGAGLSTRETLAGFTVIRLAPSDLEENTALVALIDALLRGGGTANMIGSDGAVAAIPAQMLRVFREIAEAVTENQAVMVPQDDVELTTQEAADLLHVSRPHLIKLLDRGTLPYRRTSTDPAAHRRVLVRDVLAYREERRERREALDELTRSSQEYDPEGYR